MLNCIEETGRELNLNNQGIVKYLCSIEEERKNLETIIQKQYEERKRIEAEIEKLTYKLCLINKSLSMRIKAKNNYDKTIEEIKEHYDCLVASSNKLRQVVEKTQEELDAIMNKKTGTTTGMAGEDIKILYIKPTGELDPNDCVCVDVPTKEKSKPASPSNTSTLPKQLTLSSSQEVQESQRNSKRIIEETHASKSSVEDFQRMIGNISQTVLQETSRESDSIIIKPPSETKKKSVADIDNSTASNDFPGSDNVPRTSTSKNKNLFLSRLRTSLSKPKDIVEGRLSKIETSHVEEPSLNVDHIPSDINPNQLIKRSLSEDENSSLESPSSWRH